MNQFSATTIAERALNSIANLSIDVREKLFQTKSEQTFSGMLSEAINKELITTPYMSLLELKGADYKDRRGKLTRNFHDISIVDGAGEFQVIIENKVWYHFDGAKGSKKAKLEKTFVQQVEGDIKKLQITKSDLAPNAKCFLLINVVTPAHPELLPKSYRSEHEKSWKREGGDFHRYRQAGVAGMLRNLESWLAIRDLAHLSFDVNQNDISQGSLDIFAGEVH